MAWDLLNQESSIKAPKKLMRMTQWTLYSQIHHTMMRLCTQILWISSTSGCAGFYMTYSHILTKYSKKRLVPNGIIRKTMGNSLMTQVGLDGTLIKPKQPMKQVCSRSSNNATKP